MNVTERRERIADEVIRLGEVSFSALAESLEVSEMTIRRDIEALQEEGVLRRVSGGAIAVGAVTAFEPSYGLRSHRAAGEKADIGRVVADLLEPGEVVALDSGSTLEAVAQAIRGRGLGLTVVTPSIAAAAALADEPGTTVILTGGTVRPEELSLMGPEAEAAFERYNCHTFVVGVSGVDPQRGLTEYHPQEAAVKRAAVGASSRVIAAVDASKLGRVHLVTVAPLEAVSVLVTDAEEHPVLDAARAVGVEIVRARRGGAGGGAESASLTSSPGKRST